jgi:iron complex transport system substrate-binding protein
VTLLGEILGVEDRAGEIVRYVDGQLRRVISRIEGNTAAPPSVYLEQGYLGPAAYADTYGSRDPSGGWTSWGTILHALRVRNIADGVVARQAPIHPEYLLRADPEVIVITGQNWSNPGSMRLGCNVAPDKAAKDLEAYLGRPGWDQLAAVKGRRVYGVFHNTSAITAFAGIQALAKYCYPDLFRDLDPEKNLREFHARFLPIDPGGTWACAVR